MVHKTGGRRMYPRGRRKVDSPDKREIELSERGMEDARAASLVCFVIQRRVTRSPVLFVCVTICPETSGAVVASSSRRFPLVVVRVSTHTLDPV